MHQLIIFFMYICTYMYVCMYTLMYMFGIGLTYKTEYFVIECK